MAHILMLGWEFPPMISGGLGTACYGLTKAMDRLGIPLTFVIPRSRPLRFANAGVSAEQRSVSDVQPPVWINVRFRTVVSTLRPYAQSVSHAASLTQGTQGKSLLPPRTESEPTEEHSEAELYGGDIQAEVRRYADRVLRLAQSEQFDLIHAHDWMTYPAGIALANRTGRPLVVHVHSTEFDRSGEHVNQAVYEIERHGMHTAAKVIAVSNYTRNILVRRYGVPPEKVLVVYNGVEPNGADRRPELQEPENGAQKVVLFLGRITMQKGPEYFLHAAKRVLEKMDTVRFIMAGDGDMLYRSIELAAELGIGSKVFFTRFLRGADVDRVYRMADLYVMPSVSEPFGIAPLEALYRDVPVLVSKQSGIAETLHHALKVDFWDVNEMASKMLGVLRYRPLQQIMRTNGRCEALKFRWADAATRIQTIYSSVLQAT